MRPIVRGAAAVLAAPALLLPALVATATPAQAAVDPVPATAAGYWLAGELTDGLVVNEEYSFTDYGLTIDVALGLDAVGAPASVVEGISDAVAADIDSYVAPGFGTNLSAGGTAKAMVLALEAGDDPAAYGGRDLVSDLEGRVATEGAIAGRIQDDWDSSDPFGADYANVLGQSFAVQALDAVGSSASDAATDFLLAQQCEAGYFRQDFSAVDAADQSCDAAGGEANVDVTALAITSLQSQLDDEDVSGPVADAVAWLLEVQKPNGGFVSNDELGVNANSTGAAGYALLLAGEDEAAAHAAAWLRAHQATNLANCVFYDETTTGAVLYDDTALTAAQGGAMDAALRDQTVRATAEALPGLLAAQTGAGEPRAIFTAEYVKAGGFKPVGVSAAPGEAVCAMLGEQSVLGYGDVDGDAELRVRIPARTGVSEVSVANAAGVFDTVEINALGKQRLKVTVAKRKVAKGAPQKVTVRRLAPGETATVKVGATRVQGQANGKGVLRATYTVTGKPGKKTVKVTGAFKTRAGTAQYTVTR